ncbi:VOC family protein [Streptomyces sp. NPDC018693]|uniref:VOC family protein n=1 Tax=unclassified Streptomyces TaxID=2593676 RepID=UPI0037AED6B1
MGTDHRRLLRPHRPRALVGRSSRLDSGRRIRGDHRVRPEPDQMPGLLFVPVPEGKTSKNRLHPDFRPDDQEAEVAWLLSLGARRADTVQDEQHWVTLLDPEGNEFCVLGERKG